MKHVFISLTTALIFLCIHVAASDKITVDRVANGNIYTITKTDPSFRFDSARYTVFIPGDVESIRGIFVHQHGCTMEGRGASTAYDLQYQAFAKKWSLAVVGPDLYSASGNCHNWKDPDSGSAEAFISAMADIGAESGHPEMAVAPWLLWGHSGGGYWAQAMMRDYPDRVIALFSYSPGLDPDWDYPKPVAKIPVMIRYAGPVGDQCCWKSALTTYDKLQKIGGYVSIALTPGQNHNYSFVRYMAIPFYESALSQRLPDEPHGELRDMDESRAWLGDTLTLNIYKASEYKGKKISFSWLPDSVVANRWREYSITGTVADRTPPPAPYAPGMKIISNRNVELTWRADADIESGIKHFNIYKGNSLISRFPLHGDYQRFDTNGDDAFPSSSLPDMRLELTGIVIDDQKLSVSTANHFGLESPRTEFPQ